MSRNDDGHYVIDVTTGGEKEMGRNDKIEVTGRMMGRNDDNHDVKHLLLK